MIDTLLLFSGGVDSTYCAWDYLRNNPDKTLLIYHIDQINWEGRAELEGKAVDKALEYFKANGLTNFEFHRSLFDYGTVKILAYDIILTAFFGGCLLRSKKYKDVKYILGTSPKHAFPNGQRDKSSVDRTNRKEEILNFAAHREKNYYQWKYVIKDKTKQEMLNEMPKELVDNIWYCRRPVEGKPCGECITCLQVAGKR